MIFYDIGPSVLNFLNYALNVITYFKTVSRQTVTEMLFVE